MSADGRVGEEWGWEWREESLDAPWRAGMMEATLQLSSTPATPSLEDEDGGGGGGGGRPRDLGRPANGQAGTARGWR